MVYLKSATSLLIKAGQKVGGPLSKRRSRNVRSVLRNDHPNKTLALNLKSAALISLVLVLPLAILESLNNTLSSQNVPSLMVLFGLLWLLTTAFIVVLKPLVQTVRGGNSVLAHPINLVVRIAFAAFLAIVWGLIVIDQFPCFLGVPNCD